MRFDRREAPESRLEAVAGLEDYPHVRRYTAVVNSPHFRRGFRVVVLYNARSGDYVVRASTDLSQPPDEIASYYRLRYQLELFMRDANPYAGRSQCQARGEVKLDFHLNMRVAAVNLARWLSQRVGLSMASYVRPAYNLFLVERLWYELRPEAGFDVRDPRIQRVVQTGRLAA